ncbi:hypothetical protein PMZ80_010499 [Knufia obscura]|uniref:SCP domain-containing protein n=1 Tax=Knufia obscura TaxID=1635080 RepID=A0ABR0R9A8_9EURO|nr:hypothetical protein PMZ80_010499 [Knufia obscura]
MPISNNAYGENLFGFGGTNSDSTDFIAKTGEGIDSWYSEVGSYDPNTESGAGHFTQLVWKSTTKLGCAWGGKCDAGGIEYFFYCEYDPAGNMGGVYAENVSP